MICGRLDNTLILEKLKNDGGLTAANYLAVILNDDSPVTIDTNKNLWLSMVSHHHKSLAING